MVVTDHWYTVPHEDGALLFVRDQRGKVELVAYLFPGRNLGPRAAAMVKAPELLGLLRQGVDLMAGGGTAEEVALWRARAEGAMAGTGRQRRGGPIPTRER